MPRNVKTFKFHLSPTETCSVTLHRRYCDEGPALSLSGNILIYNPRSQTWDCTESGQCLSSMVDTYPRLAKDATFNALADLWRNWHLNDAHPGTYRQEAVLTSKYRDPSKIPYTERLEVLEQAGCRIDTWNGEDCEYGTAHLYWALSDEIIELVDALLDGDFQ